MGIKSVDDNHYENLAPGPILEAEMNDGNYLSSNAYLDVGMGIKYEFCIRYNNLPFTALY
jgi:hypothetical protein